MGPWEPCGDARIKRTFDGAVAVFAFNPSTRKDKNVRHESVSRGSATHENLESLSLASVND